ncbi:MULTISPECIES: septation protein A [unclassified Bordetella]|uniref:septation protein A n=1 Tax=unclassified Bordetella TaxID=2630031 RepID=UPI0013272BBA|nr:MULTISPECIES: septation protein A [unclassified Bordetella]MVW72473.1 septation protein A [Bordetella sp. 15P40C-2]MVW77937.1 septation protein A [Bordetella sp. 02P26C-1]
MKKFLFDLFPLILFFIAYRYADIYTATAVAIAASVGQFIWLRATGKRIEMTHWINLSVIVIFGGATLWLHSDVFIKWKPTVLYWLFGGALLGARYVFGRNLMRKLLGGQLELSAPLWDKLNLSWSLFFVAAGAVNLYVAFSGHFTESQWVNFKVFGLMGLLLVFVIAQSLWLGKHMQHVEQSGAGERDPRRLDKD